MYLFPKRSQRSHFDFITNESANYFHDYSINCSVHKCKWSKVMLETNRLFILRSQMTKKSCKSFRLISWNQRFYLEIDWNNQSVTKIFDSLIDLSCSSNVDCQKERFTSIKVSTTGKMFGLKTSQGDESHQILILTLQTHFIQHNYFKCWLLCHYFQM